MMREERSAPTITTHGSSATRCHETPSLVGPTRRPRLTRNIAFAGVGRPRNSLAVKSASAKRKRRRIPIAATRVLVMTARAFGRSVHALPRPGSYVSAYRKSAGARQNEIASPKASTKRPWGRAPPRRATTPARPSRSAARRMRSAAAVNRPSATYVIARKPQRAFPRVTRSAAASLRTRAIEDLRDRALPRPPFAPAPHRQAHAPRQDQLHARAEADHPDALSLPHRVAAAHVRHDAAREDARDLRHPHEAELRLEDRLHPLVRASVLRVGRRVTSGGVHDGRDATVEGRAVHVHVEDPHEDHELPAVRIRREDAPVRGADDAGALLPVRIAEEHEREEERDAERGARGGPSRGVEGHRERGGGGAP